MLYLRRSYELRKIYDAFVKRSSDRPSGTNIIMVIIIFMYHIMLTI